MTLFSPEPDQRRLKSQLMWFGFWCAVTGVAACLQPDAHGHGTHQQLGLPPCPSVLFFDRPCPGCGLTTSWTALVQGHFVEAFHAHPLGPILYLIFTASAFLSLYGWRKKMVLCTDTPQFNRYFGVGIGVFLAFGFMRMAVTTHFASPGERLLAQINRDFSARPAARSK